MIRYNDDFIVNGVNLTPYLTNITFGYNKLWGSDTGRALSGKFTGTLIGIYPKFECTFRKLTQDEIEYLVPILDSATQQTTYYDPNKKEKITIDTYTGDYKINQSNMFSRVAKAGKSFSISFISIGKRG